ncbi:MAG: 2-aminoethylphosphonate--pyruvate transaminase [Verrucomicrobia bacterium]|nr:2-aminoethylphosphonate--pyruvate transaminase [Verrucomicrobiota bacterium]
MKSNTDLTDRNRTPGDKLLFTPGPLTTSHSVKTAMLRDLGSRDHEFMRLVRNIRDRLLKVAGVSQSSGWEAILMQGSGTFGVESMISSVIPPTGKLLILINGAYGERIADMAKRHRIPAVLLRQPENQTHSLQKVEETLAANPDISHVAMVHSETTSGIFNPVEDLGRLAKRMGKVVLVDGMSSFGAVPLDLEAAGVDFLASSANKCIEGVPGFAIILARRQALLATDGFARTLSLDLLSQWKGLEGNGQFRFTPPTHSILAFSQALDELDAEGGPEGRQRRYQQNHRALVEGMRRLGFEPYVPAQCQGWIITTFEFPKDPKFTLETFHQKLSDKGHVIYPGKLTQVDCFRIGNVGRLFTRDMDNLVAAIREVLSEMGISTK